MIGSVYKIVHKTKPDILYIGSTTLSLEARLSRHIYNKARCIISKYITEYGIDNFEIVLIKSYDVEDGKHLRAYEQLWMNRVKCINKNNAINLSKINKNVIKNYNHELYLKNINKKKQYYRDNADKRRAYQRLYNSKKRLNQ